MFRRKKTFVSPRDVAALIIPSRGGDSGRSPEATTMKSVDVRYKLGDNLYGIQQFKKSRIPGSVFAELDLDLSQVDNKESAARHPLPEPKDFANWCLWKGLGATVARSEVSQKGVSSDKRVSEEEEEERELSFRLETAIREARSSTPPILCYDDMGGAMGASRLWWMLDQLGLEAYVLDGGIQRWQHEGFPLETSDPTKQQVLMRVVKPHPDLGSDGWHTEDNDHSGSPTTTTSGGQVIEPYKPKPVGVSKVAGAASGKPQQQRSGGTQQWAFGNQWKSIKTMEEVQGDGTLREDGDQQILVDARAALRYDSTVRPEGGDPVPGHILGAINLPWIDNLEFVDAPVAAAPDAAAAAATPTLTTADSSSSKNGPGRSTTTTTTPTATGSDMWKMKKKSDKVGGSVSDGASVSNKTATASPSLTTSSSAGASASAAPYHQLKPRAELAKRYEGLLNLRKDSKKQDIVFYCGSGVTACHDIACLRHLEEELLEDDDNNTKKSNGETSSEKFVGSAKSGNIFLYPGSWSEFAGGKQAQELRMKTIGRYGSLVNVLEAKPENKYVAQVEMEDGIFREVSVGGQKVFLKDVEPRLLRNVLVRELRLGEHFEVALRDDENIYKVIAPNV